VVINSSKSLDTPGRAGHWSQRRLGGIEGKGVGGSPSIRCLTSADARIAARVLSRPWELTYGVMLHSHLWLHIQQVSMGLYVKSKRQSNGLSLSSDSDSNGYMHMGRLNVTPVAATFHRITFIHHRSGSVTACRLANKFNHQTPPIYLPLWRKVLLELSTLSPDLT
jgi:hypothetical protein